MKTLFAALFLAGFLPAAEVEVYVHDQASVSPAVLQDARAQAAWMFAKIGVRVRWHEGQPAESGPARDFTVRIDVATGTPAHTLPGALASARPFGAGVPSIRIFYDRLQWVAKGQPALQPRLLAHVLVHEIGHVLTATNHHSDDGVMKARWTSDDYAQMAKRALPFTPLDRTLILEHLAASR